MWQWLPGLPWGVRASEAVSAVAVEDAQEEPEAEDEGASMWPVSSVTPDGLAEDPTSASLAEQPRLLMIWKGVLTINAF